jgi:hypothetical protein
MLDLARKQTSANAGRVQFLQHDIASWTPAPGRYDLIVAHFVLDCFPEGQLGRIIAKLATAAAAEATWLLADFPLPKQRFARLRARIWLAAMYRFFRMTARIETTTLVDPSQFLRSHGFTLERQILFRHGLLKSEAWRKR